MLDTATSDPQRRLGNINAARIPFDMDIDGSYLTSYTNAAKKVMREQGYEGDIIGNIRNNREIELTWLPPEGTKESVEKARKGFRQVMKEISNNRSVEGVNSGGLITYADEYLPSAWVENLKNPKMRAEAEKMLPRLAREIKADVETLPLTKRGKAVYIKAIGDHGKVRSGRRGRCGQERCTADRGTRRYFNRSHGNSRRAASRAGSALTSAAVTLTMPVGRALA